MRYAHSSFTVDATWLVPLEESGGIVLLDVRTSETLTIGVRFHTDLKLMWPAGLGGQYSYWDAKLKAYVLTESLRRHAALKPRARRQSNRAAQRARRVAPSSEGQLFDRGDRSDASHPQRAVADALDAPRPGLGRELHIAHAQDPQPLAAPCSECIPGARQRRHAPRVAG